MANLAPRTTPLSKHPRPRTPGAPLRYDPPLRKWERGTVLEDGTQLWTSREWAPGEILEYQRTVLNQQLL